MKIQQILPILLITSLAAILTAPAAARPFELDGVRYSGAEMFEVGEDGVYYKLEEGGYLRVPWEKLDAYQVAEIREKFLASMTNLRLKALWVDGTVFQKIDEGVVVQLKFETKEELEPGAPAFREGAEMLFGLVIVPDLPETETLKESDPVQLIVYKRRMYSYDMGANLIKEVPFCTAAKPDWAQERVWVSREGKVLKGSLVEVKNGKCMFEMADGQKPVVPIARLSDEDQERVKAFQEGTREIVLPLHENNPAP